MTSIEKREALAVLLSPDTDTDEVLDSVLATAEAMVLNKMYPFGYEDTAVVPSRYERVQIQLAAEIYSRRGAEGQTEHTENGISRRWAAESAVLKQIVPHCGSVMARA